MKDTAAAVCLPMLQDCRAETFCGAMCAVNLGKKVFERLIEPFCLGICVGTAFGKILQHYLQSMHVCRAGGVSGAVCAAQSRQGGA